MRKPETSCKYHWSWRHALDGMDSEECRASWQPLIYPCRVSTLLPSATGPSWNHSRQKRGSLSWLSWRPAGNRVPCPRWNSIRTARFSTMASWSARGVRRRCQSLGRRPALRATILCNRRSIRSIGRCRRRTPKLRPIARPAQRRRHRRPLLQRATRRTE